MCCINLNNHHIRPFLTDRKPKMRNLKFSVFTLSVARNWENRSFFWVYSIGNLLKVKKWGFSFLFSVSKIDLYWPNYENMNPSGSQFCVLSSSKLKKLAFFSVFSVGKFLKMKPWGILFLTNRLARIGLRDGLDAECIKNTFLAVCVTKILSATVIVTL